MAYNKQQQAVILKGIAQQILQMNIPTFEVVGKMFQSFGQEIVSIDGYNKLCKEEKNFNEDIFLDHVFKKGIKVYCDGKYSKFYPEGEYLLDCQACCPDMWYLTSLDGKAHYCLRDGVPESHLTLV